ILKVFNKVDIIRQSGALEILETMFPDGIYISARTGMGLGSLGRAVVEMYKGKELLLRVVSSQANGKVQSFLRGHGRILQELYEKDAVFIEVWLGQNQLADLKKLGAKSVEIV
ncbi:unnamed protein product, partial [marine sediment metagenome]